MTWYDANNYCETLNGHLVEVFDDATENFLSSTAYNYGIFVWWLGATDEENVSK